MTTPSTRSQPSTPTQTSAPSQPITSSQPTLYELYDETSFDYWKLQLQQGNEPTLEQLSRLIEANPDRPLPAFLGPIVLKALRGELRGKRGRPSRTPLQQVLLLLAKYDYHWQLAKLRHAEQAGRDAGEAIPSKGRIVAAAHERVAEEVRQRWWLRMSARSFLNEVSSQK